MSLTSELTPVCIWWREYKNDSFMILTDVGNRVKLLSGNKQANFDSSIYQC